MRQCKKQVLSQSFRGTGEQTNGDGRGRVYLKTAHTVCPTQKYIWSLVAAEDQELKVS